VTTLSPLGRSLVYGPGSLFLPRRFSPRRGQLPGQGPLCLFTPRLFLLPAQRVPWRSIFCNVPNPLPALSDGCPLFSSSLSHRSCGLKSGQPASFHTASSEPTHQAAFFSSPQFTTPCPRWAGRAFFPDNASKPLSSP